MVNHVLGCSRRTLMRLGQPARRASEWHIEQRTSEITVIIFSGKVDIENITITHIPTTKKRSSILERDLDKLWDEEVAEMSGKGRKIWNAELYRLEGSQRTTTSLRLDLSTIEVKEVHASNRLPSEREMGEEYRTSNIFVASLIETSDGKFLFGRTNTNTLMAGRIDLIGGSLSKTERPVSDANDLFNSALCEIQEELNINASVVRTGHLCAMLRTPRSYVGLIFYVQLNIDFLEFERHFRGRDNDEITEVIAVDRQEIASFLEVRTGYLPFLRDVPLWEIGDFEG